MISETALFHDLRSSQETLPMKAIVWLTGASVFLSGCSHGSKYLSGNGWVLCVDGPSVSVSLSHWLVNRFWWWLVRLAVECKLTHLYLLPLVRYFGFQITVNIRCGCKTSYMTTESWNMIMLVKIN